MKTIDYPYLFATFERNGLAVEDYRKQGHNAEKKWRRRGIEELQGLVVHQTAGGDDVRRLIAYHTQPNHISDTGLPGAAYTLFVNKRGDVYLLNDFEDVTWSHGYKALPGDENRMYLSICFGGRFRPAGKGRPTAAQLDVLHRVWAMFKAEFGFTDLDLYGHCDFGKPNCPGDDLREAIEQYNAQVAHGLDGLIDVQRALSTLGFQPGAIDGVWGSKTQAALQRFRVSVHLPLSDARPGHADIAAIYRCLRK